MLSHSVHLVTKVHLVKAMVFPVGSGVGGQNVTVLFFIGMMMSISRSGCQIIGIKRKSQETVCDL